MVIFHSYVMLCKRLPEGTFRVSLTFELTQVCSWELQDNFWRFFALKGYNFNGCSISSKGETPAVCRLGTFWHLMTLMFWGVAWLMFPKTSRRSESLHPNPRIKSQFWWGWCFKVQMENRKSWEPPDFIPLPPQKSGSSSNHLRLRSMNEKDIENFGAGVAFASIYWLSRVGGC